MAVPLLEPQLESQSDSYPLIMEHSENHSENHSGEEHVIDITIRSSIASSRSHGAHSSEVDTSRRDGEPPSSTQVPVLLSTSSLSSTTSTSRNASLLRRGDNYSRRRHRSPLNSGLWISIELVITVSQIIASVVVLSLSRNENPQAPLFAWVVGYASGCVATLPLLYWRYLHRNQQGSAEQDSAHQGSSRSNPISESASYTTISVPQTVEEENHHTISSRSWFSRITRSGTPIPRLNALVDHFKMALDCFFAVWFVVGNVWIFGGHTSASDAPNLYRLCIVFLTFSCIGYAMPFILCATICCCLPCIISVLGFREDLGQTRGATQESIGALPTYKFKLKKNKNKGETEIYSEGGGEGGIFAAGTSKERVISAEDAVCCICLAKYADNDELRELPCSHFFHKECVDKWLKINASCPLCKAEVGESGASSSNSSWHPGLDTIRDD